MDEAKRRADTEEIEEIERRRPGRPATGHDPTRSIRVGGVWDEAKMIANERGENVNQVIVRALENYVRRHRRAV